MFACAQPKATPKPTVSVSFFSKPSDDGVVVERMSSSSNLHTSTNAGAGWHDAPGYDPIEEFAIVVAGGNISAVQLSAATHGASKMLDLDDFIHLAEEVRIPAPPKLLVDVFHHQLMTDSGGFRQGTAAVTQIDITKLFDAVAGALPKLFDAMARSSSSDVHGTAGPQHHSRHKRVHGRISKVLKKQSSVRKERRATAVFRMQSSLRHSKRGPTTLSGLAAEHAGLAEHVDLPERYVSLVAHNDMKPSMMVFVATHLEFFKQRRIVTTGSTGRALEQKLGLDVALKVSSGPLGVRGL